MYQVMVVDDDSTSLAIGKAILQSEYEVLLMKSGLQALGYLQNHSLPDVIILDMMMPGTSGMQTLQSLKSSSRFAGIPVLFLTSMDDDESEKEGILQGAVDFIHKPVNPDLLKIKIKRQIEILNLKRENIILKQRLAEIQVQVKRLCTIPKSGTQQ